ncbi:putative transcription factor interactor and regulator CCHC(Zn) family [Helianthus anomalus]
MTGTKRQYHSILYSKIFLHISLIIMNSKPSIDSAANALINQQSSIRATSRATSGREEILATTSTILSCMHCSYEKRERRWLQRKCYYCNQLGHQIASCKRKEEDEASQLIRLVVNTGTQS